MVQSDNLRARAVLGHAGRVILGHAGRVIRGPASSGAHVILGPAPFWRGFKIMARKGGVELRFVFFKGLLVIGLFAIQGDQLCQATVPGSNAREHALAFNYDG